MQNEWLCAWGSIRRLKVLKSTDRGNVLQYSFVGSDLGSVGVVFLDGVALQTCDIGGLRYSVGALSALLVPSPHF